MLINRLVVAILLVSPCIALGQTGAKALFNDPTSGVTLQGSANAAPKAKARPATPSPVATNSPPVASAKEGDVTGLRYWLEVQTEQGQLLRVTSSRIFKSGERMRLHIESNVDGSLVLLQSQDNGPFAKLFPTGNASGKVEKFKDQVFPSPTGWFRFDSKPGDIRLMVMVQGNQSSAAPVQVASAARPQASTNPPTAPGLSPEEERQLEARMRAQVDLLKGSKALMVEDDTSAKDAATYVVIDARKAPDVEKGLVAVEVKLSHR